MINKNNKSKKDNKKIDKSLKIIKREKKRIKEEKKKIKLEKDKKFYNTKFGLFLKYIFDISENDINVSKTIREKLFYGTSCALFGVFLCLIILFILSGGRAESSKEANVDSEGFMNIPEGEELPFE